MGKTWKVAVIGLGHWYSAYGLARGLAEYPHARLAAVAAEDPAQLAAFTSTFGVPGYADYREMLAREAVDIVHVAAPVSQIPEIAIAAARAGKHLVLGKPMAMTVAEADRIVEAVEARGRPVHALSGHHAAPFRRDRAPHPPGGHRRSAGAAPDVAAGRSRRTPISPAGRDGLPTRASCPEAPSSTRASTGSISSAT